MPNLVIIDDPVFIPLSDGARLAARIWRPGEGTVGRVPAILEYLPYRRRDGTCERDALTHPWFAANGYACVRVDMRGAGDSDGLLLGEYLKQEQDDALEVIAWIAAQDWCSGAVGMIGISWGGFNSLQIAARQPAALKAVISICSTDDRYADDIHYMGGALLTNKMSWASDMLAITCNPPDPAIVGERWREMWLQRLDEQGLWMLDWLSHQRRDDFYRHGSVCEDYSAIRCPVYLVGGWADGYSNAVFRLLSNLQVPVKGLVGPWAHKYPHFAKPGPQIGFLQECLGWWDHWLKGYANGVMEAPLLHAWISDGMAPLAHIETQDGYWVTEPGWPTDNITSRRWSLRPGLLADTPGDQAMQIRSPATVGLAFGSWSPSGLDADLATDQRIEAGGSLVFDSAPLELPIEMLGAAVAELTVCVDTTQAQIACVLSEVLATGPVTRVSYAVRNLSHRDSHAEPTPLKPGHAYSIRMRLNEFGHRFAAGSRIRLAISTSYWPAIWPAPAPVTLTVGADSVLDLPVRREPGVVPLPFPPGDGAAKLPVTVIRPSREARYIKTDLVSGVVEHVVELDKGEWRLDDIDLTLSNRSIATLSIHPEQTNSARHETSWERSLVRDNWSVRTRGSMCMTSDTERFHVNANVEAFEGDKRVFARSWNESIARDNL